jgi:hypothetical protein
MRHPIIKDRDSLQEDPVASLDKINPLLSIWGMDGEKKARPNLRMKKLRSLNRSKRSHNNR